VYCAEILQTNGSQKGMYACGSCHSLPEAGETFDFETADSLVQTSTVTFAEFHRDHVFFETANSSYLLKILETPAETQAYQAA
jgi:hypothetical protein